MINNNKNIDIKKTVLLNFGPLVYPILVITYLILCLNAINNVNTKEPILKLPFIIIIAYSTIKLFINYNPKINLIKKGK